VAAAPEKLALPDGTVLVHEPATKKATGGEAAVAAGATIGATKGLGAAAPKPETKATETKAKETTKAEAEAEAKGEEEDHQPQRKPKRQPNAITGGGGKAASKNAKNAKNGSSSKKNASNVKRSPNKITGPISSKKNGGSNKKNGSTNKRSANAITGTPPTTTTTTTTATQAGVLNPSYVASCRGVVCPLAGADASSSSSSSTRGRNRNRRRRGPPGPPSRRRSRRAGPPSPPALLRCAVDVNGITVGCVKSGDLDLSAGPFRAVEGARMVPASCAAGYARDPFSGACALCPLGTVPEPGGVCREVAAGRRGGSAAPSGRS
jgi:hypothetical protein